MQSSGAKGNKIVFLSFLRAVVIAVALFCIKMVRILRFSPLRAVNRTLPISFLMEKFLGIKVVISAKNNTSFCGESNHQSYFI